MMSKKSRIGEDGFDDVTDAPEKGRGGLRLALAFGIGGVAALMTGVWGASWLMAATAPTAPPLPEDSEPVAQVSFITAPANPTDIRSVRSSGILALAPGWIYEPMPQAMRNRATVAVAAPAQPANASLPVIPLPLPRAAVAEASIAAVPLPIANPLAAGRGGNVATAEQAAAPEAPNTFGAAPVPMPNPLGDTKVRLAMVTPVEPPLASEPGVSEVPDPHTDQVRLPTRSDRFAVYDIRAKVVYMPSGEKLEAHSGYGDKFDDPRHVSVKMLGPTPPNVYKLHPREALFHGVEALRMTPIGEGPMYGRVGLLTHTYLLGARGDSNGCVSFKDYERFLAAYKRGEVNRLVVVDSMPKVPSNNPLIAWLTSSR